MPKPSQTKPPSDADVAPLKPAFLRVPAAVQYSGVSRTSLYELIAEGRIKSTVLRKRNNVRGIRLIEVESLDALLRGEG